MWRPVVICHQLRSADNLGAIARVMANFGCAELILADPATHDFRGVGKLGVGAESVLERFAVATSLQEALQDVVYAVGTTSRGVLKRATPLSPEEGAARLAQHSTRGRVALVMGSEKRGLSDDELALCQEVIAIPTPGPQPSMNIAQATAVLLYLCTRAAAPQLAPTEGARLELLHQLEALMREVLLDAEFLNPQAPDHVLRELSRSLVKGQLTQREAGLWRAAFEKLKRGLTSAASR